MENRDNNNITDNGRVAYILKMYPRFSETFIVNEILAHEETGLQIDLFSLRIPVDGCFHEILAKVKAKVTYIPYQNIKANEFWRKLQQIAKIYPQVWSVLENSSTQESKNIYQALLIAQEIDRRKITHIHAHFGSIATSIARLVSMICNVDFTFTTHAKDIYHQDVDTEELKIKMLGASKVVTVSEYNHQYLRDQYGNAADGVVQIYNGLDLDRFPYHAPENRQKLIVSVGRLVEKKGFPDLIAACAELLKFTRQFKCLIIGQGELELVLREKIKALNLGSHILMLGSQSQYEVIEILKQASVFAAPFVIAKDGNRDGLPTVLLEAMALGTPCIATNVTGVPEVLIDGVTGELVPQGNPVVLAETINRMLGNPKLRQKYAHKARRLIEEKFDIHKNTAIMRQYFNAKSCYVTRETNVTTHN